MTSSPGLARWLLNRIGIAQDRRFIIGDLDEEFARRAHQDPRAARRWYWRQTLASIIPLAPLTLRGAHLSLTSARGDSMWRTLADDLRYAMRLTLRRPLAAFAVVLTTVLGVGATTAVFSVVNGILLKPLPFAESDRVVRLGMIDRSGQYTGSMAYPDMQDYARDTHSVASFGVADAEQITLTQGSEPKEMAVVYADSGYARVFSLQAGSGRLFAADEYRFGSAKVVLISDGFWRREFGADRTIVGRTISLNNETYQVIGVLSPQAYTYPEPAADAILPLTIAPGNYRLNRGAEWLTGFGKLRDHTSLETARAEMRGIATRLSHDFPDANGGLTLQVDHLRDGVIGEVRPLLILLSVAVAAVLLIACVNIANLLLGQSQGRSREFAMRAALGGSGGRIVRQLLTESVALAGVGGIIGMLIVRPMTKLFVDLYPGELPRLNEIGIDGRVLLIAAAATVAAGVLSGIPSMRRALALNLVRDLRDGSRAGNGRRQRRIGGVLVASQVALSLALLFAAGLLLQSFRRLSAINPGFATSHLTTFHLWPAPARHSDAASITRFYTDVEIGLRQLPGVTNVAVGTDLPLSNSSFGDVLVDDIRGDLGNANPQARRGFVNPQYWATLGVPLIAGREFTAADDSTAPNVMVVNQALARRYYPGLDPVGRSISWSRKHWRIVGVVGAMRNNLIDLPEPEFFMPSAQVALRARYVVVKSPLPVAQVLTQARNVVGHLDATIPLTDVATMDQRVGTTVAPQRFRATMVVSLGALAVLLSIVGIYGVVAYDVGRQTRDIGIRMALGEEMAHSTRRVVIGALQPALMGAALGIVLALAAGQAMASLLVEISPRNTPMLSSALLLILAVAAAAAYVPARRASRVDPLTALRGE